MAMAFKMATTGMSLSEECVKSFQDLKRNRSHRYIVFKIDEKAKQILIDKTGGAAENYQDFTDSLPRDDCRYGVFDFDFVSVDNCQKSKIFFIYWSPAKSRVRSKMLYATSKERLRRELDGVHYELQATDPTEMDIQVIRDRAS